MKTLKCDLCGSVEILKNGDFFVCQHCGCKYTAEEARKLMIEGKVSIDNSQKLKNLYILARRARSENNITNAENYYKQILLEEPDSWEANFYSVYYAAANCKIGGMVSAAYSVSNCLSSTFKLIKERVPQIEQKMFYLQMTLDVKNLMLMFRSAMTDYASKFNAADPSGTFKFMQDNETAFCHVLINLADKLIDLFDEKDTAQKIYKEVSESYGYKYLPRAEREALIYKIRGGNFDYGQKLKRDLAKEDSNKKATDFFNNFLALVILFFVLCPILAAAFASGYYLSSNVSYLKAFGISYTIVVVIVGILIICLFAIHKHE